jgi:hypothetical protein
VEWPCSTRHRRNLRWPPCRGRLPGPSGLGWVHSPSLVVRWGSRLASRGRYAGGGCGRPVVNWQQPVLSTGTQPPMPARPSPPAASSFPPFLAKKGRPQNYLLCRGEDRVTPRRGAAAFGPAIIQLRRSATAFKLDASAGCLIAAGWHASAVCLLLSRSAIPSRQQPTGRIGSGGDDAAAVSWRRLRPLPGRPAHSPATRH